MTQSNLSHTEKVPTEQNATQRELWGTIILAVLSILLAAYFLSMLLRQPKTPVIYGGIAVFLAVATASVLSLFFTLRNRQPLGIQILFFAINLLGIMVIGLFQGRAATSSFTILILSAMIIAWLMPSQLKRSYSIIAAVAFIIMWALEWINPSWRLQIAAAAVGPIAGLAFALLLGIMALLQSRTNIANRFLSLSLRAKLLISITSITGLSLLVYGGIFLYRTQQSQTFLSNKLQSTVQQQSQQQITDFAQAQAHTADQALSEITLVVRQLADYRTSLFSQLPLLGQGMYWDANSRLIKRADGQYANAGSEPASVFIPNTETPSPEFIADLNDSMYLNFSAPGVLNQNTNIAAVYYVSADNYTVYYPNIDLSSAVPADFDARTQSFYTVATPENDPEHKPVWTAPYQDPAGTGLIVTASVPVYDKNNHFRGVMSADVQLSKILAEISSVKVGQTGFAFLIDPSGHIIAMPDAGYNLFGITQELVAVGETPKTTLLGLGPSDLQAVTKKMVQGESGLATVTMQATQYYVAYSPLPVIGFSLGLIAPTTELDAAYLTAREQIAQETRVTTSLSMLILLVVLLAAGAVSLFLGQFLSKPLMRLTETATEVAKGNLSVKAEVQANDEIGILASTFNTMTSRLQEILGSLEQRVAARTHNLELAAEVGRAVSQVHDLDVMLRDACNLILKEFDLYYVQVYLTDPSQSKLILEAGTGSVGTQLVERGHNLPFDTTSINGRAAVEKQTVLISDTSKSTTFRQNPLLPATRGEMAVPLIVANKVVGVLDMQSSGADVLTQEVLPAFEALAGQLAVAVRNASLLAETEAARAEVEKQARRLVRANWDEHLDAIHKPEQIGYIFERQEVTPLIEAGNSQTQAGDKAVSAPIAVAGEALGSLVVELESDNEQVSELVNVVARQVAQQIENLRLIESAERYRAEAEQAIRRQTHENWQNYFKSEGNTLGYLYDTNEVRPNTNGHETNEDMFTLPLKVRDEAIGKLAIQGIGADDNETMNLVNAIADRLSSHIEGLRQSHQTQSALTQSEKLFEASRKLTQATDLQQLVDATVTTLNIPEINRAILVAFDYGASNDIVGLDVIANWWNGSGHPATATGTHYSRDVIQVMPMFVSPTPVFFDDTFTDERVDGTTMQLVQRLNLRAVAVLPLHTASGQIGALILESEVPHHFSSEETRLFIAIAPQIATIMDNRRQFEHAQKQAEREAMLNTINQKIQSATSVEAVLQIAARELGHALGAPMTIAQLSMKDKSS